MFRRVLLVTLVLACIPIVITAVVLLFVLLRAYYWCLDRMTLQNNELPHYLPLNSAGRFSKND
ncbi:MAG: hypothetical protein ACI96M_002391 [Candidatus Azotimanducaceae bacterium]|jgi:hypothetical protein